MMVDQVVYILVCFIDDGCDIFSVVRRLKRDTIVHKIEIKRYGRESDIVMIMWGRDYYDGNVEERLLYYRVGWPNFGK
jgi:hypothetical protein